MQKEKHSNFL